MRSGSDINNDAVSDIDRSGVIVAELGSIAWQKRLAEARAARELALAAKVAPSINPATSATPAQAPPPPPPFDEPVPDESPIAVEMTLHPELGAALASPRARVASIRADWSGLGRRVVATFAMGLAVGALMAPSPLAAPAFVGEAARNEGVSIEIIALTDLGRTKPGRSAAVAADLASSDMRPRFEDEPEDQAALIEAFAPARGAGSGATGSDAGFASSGGLVGAAKVAAIGSASPVNLGFTPSAVDRPPAPTFAPAAAVPPPTGRDAGHVEPHADIDLSQHAASLAKIRLLVRPPPGESVLSGGPLLEAAGVPFEAMPAPPFKLARTLVQYFDSRDAPAAEALAKAFDGDLMNLTRFNPPPPDRRVEVLLGE